MFKEHFEELITRGYVYVACPPKYRITVNNKNIHFKNDEEFDNYKAKYVSQRYSVKTKGISMISIIKKSEDFILKFNLLKDKYSLPTDIISMILSCNDILEVAEYLDEQGLSVSEIDDHLYYAQGLLDNDWIDVEFNNELIDSVKELKNIFGASTIIINDKKENEEYECDIYDAIDLINKEFKFARYRYKGLNESLALIPLTYRPVGVNLLKIS